MTYLQVMHPVRTFLWYARLWRGSACFDSALLEAVGSPAVAGGPDLTQVILGADMERSGRVV